MLLMPSEQNKWRLSPLLTILRFVPMLRLVWCFGRFQSPAPGFSAMLFYFF